MVPTRQYTVEHKDLAVEAEKLIGTIIHDPQPGEEGLVCTSCHAVRMVGTQVTLEAVYRKPEPLVAIVPVPTDLVKHNG